MQPITKIRQFIELWNPNATRAYANLPINVRSVAKIVGRDVEQCYARFRRVRSFLGEHHAGKTELSKGDRSTQRCQLPRGVFPRPTDFIQPAPLSILIASTWTPPRSVSSTIGNETADATCRRE